jgi:hypothetical protein
VKAQIVYAYIYVKTDCVCIHTHTCIHICEDTDCVCIHTHTCIHTYVHIYILNGFLRGVLGHASTIILTILFFKVNIFPLSDNLPRKIVPHFII